MMPTLAELVKFKNDLSDTIDNLSLESEVLEKTRLVDTIKCRHEITDYHQDIEQYLQLYQNLLAKNNDIIVAIKNTIEKIDNDINIKVQSELDASKFTEDSIHQLLSTNQEIEKIIQARIGGYSDWRFPGLQLHCRYDRLTPGLNNFVNPKDRINPMVANDPLYLVGSDINALNETIISYPEIYQRRVRLYEIKKRDLSILPHAQFGFILCWDFLNYLPLSVIEWYLKSILALLRPGGILLFSYTNGNIEKSAEFVDRQRCFWATDLIMKKMVVEVGFNIIDFKDLATNDNEKTWVSWAEIQKPGTLQTVRKNQAIGKVLTK
jgi:hypothetical protein